MAGFFSKRSERAGVSTRPAVYGAAALACAAFAALVWASPVVRPAPEPPQDAVSAEPAHLTCVLAAVPAAISLADGLASQ